jgi:Lrp/AsnC family transcriptional regulator, leucine-responsive regulatory protein
MGNHRKRRPLTDGFKVFMLFRESSVPALDPTDVAIIEVLQEDGRIAISELGRRVGLSQPATSERVKRLEERGIITGYTAKINPAALGLRMMAVIRLRTTHEHIQSCLKQIFRNASRHGGAATNRRGLFHSQGFRAVATGA